MTTNNGQKRIIHSLLSSLKGTPYEIGQQIGQWVLAHPMAIHAMKLNTAQEMIPEKMPDYQKYFPHVYEEMQGTADTLKIPINHLRYSTASYLKSGYCSQFALPAQKTSSNSALIARNYEFADQMDDMNICHHQGTNSYAHIGSIMLWFGRYDGLNDQGVAISMSAGGLPVGERMLKPPIDGFQFWTTMRVVLDRCASVEEAIDLIREIPHCGNPVYLLADSSGTLARVEVFGKEQSVKKMSPESASDFLIATNHLQDLQNDNFQIPVFKNSHIRYKLIENFINNNETIGETELQTFLDQTYPQGLCCNYYQEGFGTLRSMIFNPVAKTISVRFGSPILNEWKTISIAQPFEEGLETTLLDEIAPAVFWEKV
ncbi:MAG: hypothetical protein JEZ00_14710 [Anaerolineaceae bacterium]|nr:hypothetical protein [Anaerolineaceae bacterium]